MPTEALEREVKLGVGLDFSLPDLNGVIHGVTEVELPRSELVAVYHDTADRRLLARGITLRHRHDRAVPGDQGGWTLKLPIGSGGPAVERNEVSWPGAEAEPPEEMLRLIRGVVRRAELKAIVKLVTSRRRFEIHGPTGRRLAEIDDDTVAVMEGLKLSTRFREVEVELETEDDELLDSVVGRLHAAGAQRAAQQAKVAHALGLPAAPSSSETPTDQLTLADVANVAIAGGLDRLLDRDPWVRLSGDADHIHQARVATRRLRSDLKTFRPVLEAAWVDDLRTTLRWAGTAFGEVRDADVLGQRLGNQGHDELTDADGEGVTVLQERLASERQAAYVRLLAVLDSDRYLNLLDTLSAPPPWRPESADRASSATGPLVRRAWKKLHQTVGNLGDGPADAELHQTRIRAKQLRYGSEAAAIVVGKPARQLARAAAQLQEILGEHHDAVAAEAWLRRQASTLEVGPGVFVAGELVTVQRREQARLGQDWHGVWDGLAAKRLRRWLH